jgi:DNA repair protein RadC
MNDYVSIKNWKEDEKPREKLLKHGKQALSDAELIAILLGTGTKETSAIDLARALLLLGQNNLNELARLSVKDLCKVNGIGPAKAITIIAAIELGARKQHLAAVERPQIRSSREAYLVMKSKLEDLSHEEFWVITLDRKNSVINTYRISEGGITGTVVDVRKILKIALDDKSTGIMLFHNHPSGNLQPSHADIELTKKMTEAGKIMDISVLDHLIITQTSYYSFTDESLI